MIFSCSPVRLLSTQKGKQTNSFHLRTKGNNVVMLKLCTCTRILLLGQISCASARLLVLTLLLSTSETSPLGSFSLFLDVFVQRVQIVQHEEKSWCWRNSSAQVEHKQQIWAQTGCLSASAGFWVNIKWKSCCCGYEGSRVTHVWSSRSPSSRENTHSARPGGRMWSCWHSSHTPQNTVCQRSQTDKLKKHTTTICQITWRRKEEDFSRVLRD